MLTLATTTTDCSSLVGGSAVSVSIAGSGQVLARMGRKGLIVTAMGTDSASVLAVARTKGTHASRGAPPMIARLTIRSRSLGPGRRGHARNRADHRFARRRWVGHDLAGGGRERIAVDNPTPFPTRSTSTAGVISTPHGDEADHAGFFAADTRGVFVGVIPR